MHDPHSEPAAIGAVDAAFSVCEGLLADLPDGQKATLPARDPLDRVAGVRSARARHFVWTAYRTE